MHRHNIIIYTATCAGGLTPIKHEFYEGKTVRTLKWCCDIEPDCPQCPWLAVGGDPVRRGDKQGATIILYLFDPCRYCLHEFAHKAQPGKVFSLAWLDSCNCKRLAAGSGCLLEPCSGHNIVIYSIEKCGTPELKEQMQTVFDDSITSLTTGTVGHTTYFFAGAESNKWKQLSCQPLCCTHKKTKELAMFKGRLCSSDKRPRPLCLRPVC